MTSIGEAEAKAVSAKIINLVHDSILRRDRESEQREHLAITIQNLRSTEAKNNAEIGRLQLQNAELHRQLSLAQGQEHSLKANVRRAEDAAKAVREEMLRLKVTIKNVRAQCANDLRQQDLEIRRLRSHLEAKQRGARAPPTAAPVSTESSQHKDATVPLTSPEYSLSQESSEFLAQLCQSLSDENDSLIALIQSSLARLRSIQGLRNARMGSDESNKTKHRQAQVRARAALARALPTPCGTLATEMQRELDQLQNILTNPSFVPIEEVEAREEEIIRLRQGWEKMEARWREAVAMMDGWRRRIADDGTLIDGDGASHSPVKSIERRDLGEEEEADMPNSIGSDVTEVHGSGEKEKASAKEASTSENSPRRDQVTLDTPRNHAVPETQEGRTLNNDWGGSSHVLKEIHLNIEESKAEQERNADATVKEKNHGDDQPRNDTSVEIHLPEPPGTAASRLSPKKIQSKAPPSTISSRQSTRKRQASTEVPATKQPKSKLARATTIEQKLRDAKNEADEAASTVGRCEAKTGKTRKVTASRPRKKRNTLSPEELEYLLGVS